MVSTITSPTAQDILIAEIADYATHKNLIHSIRQDVFVLEQSIPFELEADQYDHISQHVLAFWNGRLAGTGRLTPNGRIGRVAVSYPVRRRGVGGRIMEKLLEIASHHHHREVMLAAQSHAITFYEKMGFQREGSPFEELGIEHVMMRKQLP